MSSTIPAADNATSRNCTGAPAISHSNHSYFKFLSSKLPLATPEDEVLISFDDNNTGPSQVIKPLTLALLIVEDNHKSHAKNTQLESENSTPTVAGFHYRSSSAPIINNKKSITRWETQCGSPRPGTASQHAELDNDSPQPPRRSLELPRSTNSNAQWSVHPEDGLMTKSPLMGATKKSLASADRSRLKSLGLADLKPRSPTKSPKTKRLKSSGSPKKSSRSSSRRSGITSDQAGCRWSLPATASDSLLVYPIRCGE